MAIVQLVTFELCGEEYAIDITMVNGIVKFKNYNIVKIPNATRGLEGFINLRGKAIPLFNLKKKFQYDHESIDEDSKIIVLHHNGTIVGFIVDEVTDIFKLKDEEIEPVPNSIRNNCDKYIKGIGKADDKMVVILDLIKVLTDNEIRQSQAI
ncbi:chemotaxis protein CheW [Heliobacillus mobilis]|uniref:Chemotaxis protein CheW n=1 Tax=Heliobacterium mobile TaxID=28064 RepID=A0A6I3SLK1_HELMO|nr:chemotaxis protein CheW [Heliobacterium mobile]MTV49769.1 chemotaxis protein CheW [Heliobacterium mobile]